MVGYLFPIEPRTARRMGLSHLKFSPTVSAISVVLHFPVPDTYVVNLFDRSINSLDS